MKTIYLKDRKNQTLATQTVRALLKNSGFKIGSWAPNGMIKGMSNFFGGNLGIKSNEFNSTVEEGVSYTGDRATLRRCRDLNVIVSIWTYMGVDVDIKELLKVLKGAGYYTKEGNKEIIVDNKIIK